MKARPVTEWRSSRDGPWPAVHIGGELEAAQREWLHTNGAGAYAMSTIALMHKRRYHGVLVASLPQPLGRYVILSHGETSVITPHRTYRLSTHQFPNVAPTPGYRLLDSFAQDPIPRWTFRLGKATFERTLSLVRGKNAAVLGYTWHGRGPVRLSIRPLLPLRPIHALMHEHGGMVQRIILRSGEVEVQPVAQLPPVVFGHSGVFVGSPDWWRRFEYLDDRERSPDFQEDLWTPGVFEIALEPGITQYLQIAVGALPREAPSELVAQTAAFIGAQDPGPDRPPSVRVLSVAAEQFCADARAKPLVVSGYPFSDLRTRDLSISLPGLYLCRGRIDEAKRVLSTLVKSLHAGLLPKDLERVLPRERRPAPDATLWLFEAVRALVDRVGLRDEVVTRELYPALGRIFLRVRRRRRRGIWLSPSGLVATGDSAEPLTWLDVNVGGHAAAPRVGLAIELQPLWARGCELLASLAGEHSDVRLAEAAARAAHSARAAFRSRFWCNETRYPFDCISESSDTADAWADPTIRPNAVIALALDPTLFEPWQAVAIVERARDELVTPRGLRTLSPRDAHYAGHYAGTRQERDSIAHQGAAWTFLLGSYVRAALRLGADDPELVDELRALVTHAADDGPVLGQVAQLAEGDPPHRPRGCPAQAWSVAELLRVLVDDLGL